VVLALNVARVIAGALHELRAPRARSDHTAPVESEEPRGRLANEPLLNHWWNVPLYVTARRLTTSVMPLATGPAFQIDFDLVDHRLDIVTVNGDSRSVDGEGHPDGDGCACGDVDGVLPAGQVLGTRRAVDDRGR